MQYLIFPENHTVTLEAKCAVRSLTKGLIAFINSMPEEHVSNDLDEAAGKHVKEYFDMLVIKVDSNSVEAGKAILDFKAGAQWQKDKLITWLTREADYLLQELKKGNKAYGLAEQYRAQLYKEVVNKLIDE